jgi:hypothetical protein
MPTEYAWLQPVLIAAVIVFVIDSIGNIVEFNNRFVNALVTAVLFAIVFGLIVTGALRFRRLQHPPHLHRPLLPHRGPLNELTGPAASRTFSSLLAYLFVGGRSSSKDLTKHTKAQPQKHDHDERSGKWRCQGQE